MKIHPSNALSGNLCLSVQLSAWTLHHQCFQINCFISLSVIPNFHLFSLPPHFQSISQFIVRNVRICICETPPVIKNTIKNLTSDLSGIWAQLFQKSQISCITEKKCIISTDILKMTFMILICFDLCNLFVCRKWPTKRKAKAGRMCMRECVCVRAPENTNYEVYDLTVCWTTGVTVTVGWTCSLSHSQAVFCGLNGSPVSFI